MRERVFVGALAVAVLAGACGGDDDGADTESRPGNPAVYERIEGLSDCAELQKEFETAMDTYDRRKEEHSLEYAKAAEKRRDALDCP